MYCDLARFYIAHAILSRGILKSNKFAIDFAVSFASLQPHKTTKT